MSTRTIPDRTQVLIIGAGPVGLTLAGLLARAGVHCVVVERRTETLRAPAAHVLRNTSRAVLALLEVDDEIEAAIPPLPMRCITWCTTLGGSEIGRLDITGTDPSVRPWTNLSQNRLEPILQRAVEALPGVTLTYGTQCNAVTQHDDEITADVTFANGSTDVITADWVVAADGASSRTREQLGIEMGGAGQLGKFFMVHFRADLSPWVDHRPGPIFWIANPEAPGTLIIHDVRSSHVFMTPVMGVADEQNLIGARLAAALALPITPEIVSIDAWRLNCQVAERYRIGRCLLVGDAAHRFPPSGGLGMNTGILEAYDLAGRLAAICRHGADHSALDDYEAHCRPVALANADESLENALRLSLVSDVLGQHPTLHGLQECVETLSDAERRALADAIDQQWSHFMSDGTFPPSINDFIDQTASTR